MADICHIEQGDRIIHTFELEESSLTALAKYESGTLQQGIAFLPKRHCNVKEIEIGKFYRLTPTNIETVGIKVPRARVHIILLCTSMKLIALV
jgi:coronin-7